LSPHSDYLGFAAVQANLAVVDFSLFVLQSELNKPLVISFATSIPQYHSGLAE